MQARYPYLDGWRGLAIILVLIGHFTPLPGIDAGDLGVELFFVLSGRLMAEILFLQKMEIGLFFRRRISRIFPGLFFFCTSLFVAGLALKAHGSNRGFSLVDYLAGIGMWTNYRLAFAPGGSVLMHTWSLAVEEHAYLILGVIAVLTARSRRTAAWVTGGLGVLCLINGAVQYALLGHFAETVAAKPLDLVVYWKTDVRAAPILLSCCLCLWRPQGRYAVAAFLMGVIASFSIVPPPLRHSAAAVLFALAVNGIDQTKVRAVFDAPWLRQVGLWSFSVYLWQQPFYANIGKLPWFVMLPAGFACGLASFYLIENPARRWLNRHWTSWGGEQRKNNPTSDDVPETGDLERVVPERV